MVPGPRGGTRVVYYNVIRPFVLNNQKKIDQHISEAKEAIYSGSIFNFYTNICLRIFNFNFLFNFKYIAIPKND